MKTATGICLSILLGLATQVSADPETRRLESLGDKPLTDSEIRQFLDKKEEYREDPKALEMMNQIQEAVGITEDDVARVSGEQTQTQAETPATDTAPKIDANANVAEQAYRNGDYETARAHYEALAAEGDGYANLMLGLMYHQGQGVDKNFSKAHAYYDRAADYGEDRGSELNSSLEYEMSEQQKQQASDDYSSLVNQQQEAGAPAATKSDKRPTYRRPLNPDTGTATPAP